MKRTTVIVMTGIAFTFGMFLGLLIQLPAATLPAFSLDGDSSHVRFKRSLEELQPNSESISLLYDSNEKSSPEIVGRRFGNNSHITYISLPKDVPRDNMPPATAEPSLINNQVLKEGGKNTRVSDNSQPEFEDSEKYRNAAGDVPNEAKRTEVSITLGKVSKSANIKSSRSNEEKKHLPIAAIHESEILNGITWSESLHSMCPSGFTQRESDSWAEKLSSSKFVKLEEGCGRMQNRMLTFTDATKACVRYRLNTDQIQGEIYSYYLGKLLNITNLPPTKLELVKPNEELWRRVHLDIARSQWSVDKVVVVTKWIDDLGPAYIPPEFRETNVQLKPDSSALSGKTGSELCELLQWSDLIVFDYLTANLDRVVNNMFNKQWNVQMMENPTHNLEKSKNGRLVFLDNESGLFHGYRLLDKYTPFHEELLHSLCVFRKSTIDGIRRLVQGGSVEDELYRIFAQSEPLHKHVPKIPQKYVKILKQRLNSVLDHIHQCERTYLR